MSVLRRTSIQPGDVEMVNGHLFVLLAVVVDRFIDYDTNAFEFGTISTYELTAKQVFWFNRVADEPEHIIQPTDTWFRSTRQ